MTDSKPKAVIFDLGKVLLDFDYGIAIRRLAPKVQIPADQIHALVNQSGLLHDYESGAIGTDQFFARIQAASGYRGTLDEFGATFADIFVAIEPMIALHAQLRRLGVPTYILSNTNELAVRHVIRHYPFFSQFDGYVLSYEHRVMKPAPEIYAIAEALARHRGPDLFYIDDWPENVEAARRRGWRAVLHQTPEQSRAAVAAAGLLDEDAAP
ncbi:MAG TPA: HAD family phosphatase [Verrucomicrobiota bacterium]|nr:HAD family phosphatase [Verrucomicrobiota bacterium]